MRANYGLQYTFQANAGGSVRFLAGQSYHLSGDNIFRNPGVDSDGRFLYSPVTGLERSASDYVLGLYVSPLSGFRAGRPGALRRADARPAPLGCAGRLQLRPDVRAGRLRLHGREPGPQPAHDQQEIMAMLGFRVTDRWSVSGQTRYSLDDNRPIQNIAQLRYADECYVMTANYIETHITDAARDIRPDRTLMFRVRAEVPRRVPVQDERARSRLRGQPRSPRGVR